MLPPAGRVRRQQKVRSLTCLQWGLLDNPVVDASLSVASAALRLQHAIVCNGRHRPGHVHRSLVCFSDQVLLCHSCAARVKPADRVLGRPPHRSCRERLMKHNENRRKGAKNGASARGRPPGLLMGEGSGDLNARPRQRVRQRRRRRPGRRRRQRRAAAAARAQGRARAQAPAARRRAAPSSHGPQLCRAPARAHTLLAVAACISAAYTLTADTACWQSLVCPVAQSQSLKPGELGGRGACARA